MALVIGAIYGFSNQDLNKTWEIEPVAYTVPEGEDAIADGKALATYRGCLDCHGEALSGKVFLDEMPVARLVAPNLTGGKIGAECSDEDWARAIRHGVTPAGRPIIFPMNGPS